MKVSLITVSYNSAKTIADTLKSVQAQTYKDIEYIVVDGNSNDGTIEIVKQFLDYKQNATQGRSEGVMQGRSEGASQDLSKNLPQDLLKVVNQGVVTKFLF